MRSRVAHNISYKNFLVKTTDISCPKLKVAQFQRNYVWKKKNIDSLIDSIEENDKKFYIGNIVVQRSRHGSSGKDLIVDGQQRLITLSLIVHCLKKDKKNTDNYDKIIFYPGSKNPRISFSRETLNKAYTSILKDRSIEDIDEAQKVLVRSYKAILRRIKKIKDPELFFEKINFLEFVVIKCANETDVHQLFESLNSKNEKLSVVQLTKNALLADIATSRRRIFNKINSKWEKIERAFESEKIIWFDKFLRHDWFSLGGYTSENQLFEKIKSYIKDIGAEKYSQNMLEDSDIYLSIRKSEIKKSDLSSDMDEVAWKKAEYLIKLTKELQLDQVYAVLLSLVKYGKNKPEYFLGHKFFKDIEKIWSFLILIKYSKVSPSSYEKDFANFCFDIHNEKNLTFGQIKTEFFEQLKKRIPNEEEFTQNINEHIRCTGERSSKVNFKNNNEIIRTVLLAYLSQGKEIIGDFTIEHIVPKGSLKKWNNISKSKIDGIENNYRYRLGNLTLLKDDKVGDKNFNTKYKLAYSKSSLSLNRKLKTYKILFNSADPGKAIRARGKEIASSLYKIYSDKIK